MQSFTHRSVFALLVISISASSTTSAASIDIEIRNRFRSFDYIASSAQESAALFEQYAPKSSDVSTTAWVQRLADNGHASAYSQSRTGPWIESAGKDDLPYKEDFLSAPKTLAIHASLVDGSIAEGKACAWSIDQKIAAQQPCFSPFEPTTPVLNGATISVAVDGSIIANTIVNPKVRVILGVGDSYSAGEGSPDVPVMWKTGLQKNAWPFNGHDDINGAVAKPTEWLSNRCNRSFYSYQNMVALRLAADDKHSIVAFVHLACAGAEVLDGMLAPQRVAPGAPEVCKGPIDRPKSMRDDVDPACDVPYSQLHAAAKILCPDHATVPFTHPMLEAIRHRFDGLAHGHEGGTHQEKWIDDLVSCARGPAHPVEYMLMTIGGNDIGFGGLIRWALLPRRSRIPFAGNVLISEARKVGSTICPLQADHDEEGYCSHLPAVARLRELPERYAALNSILNDVLGINGSKIVVSQYPNPLRDENGRLCSNEPNKSEPNAWSALHVEISGLFQPRRWQINLTEWEAGMVEKWVVVPLNDAVRAGAATYHWRLGLAADAFKGHGWCVGDNANKLLHPENATQWKPYISAGRYIRSGNDAFLTQWPGITIGMQRSDGLNGTFHPNALGYSAMADRSLAAIAEELRK